MNKHCYYYGNIFKVKFRKHNCYKCGHPLTVIRHHKVVEQNSEEAKYYDFDAGGDGGLMVGPCEFIHKVFYCSKCDENIEFLTQTNQEDIDIIIKKTQNKLLNKGRKVKITKFFENNDGDILREANQIDLIANLCLVIEEEGKESMTIKTPLRRRKIWERPYYFSLTKEQLLKHFK